MRILLVFFGIVILLSSFSCAPPGPEPDEVEEPIGLENGSFLAELNGFTIHYEVHGQGPVVMTVPNSWGLSLEALRAMYRPLEERVTMVYFDPRGMGESDPVREDADMGLAAVRSDFDALRRHLGLDRVHAIGWSNGAMNLIHLAAERPEVLSSAIFLHGTASFTQEDMAQFSNRYPELMARYEAFQQELSDETMSDDDKTARIRTLWLEDFFPEMLANPQASQAVLDEVFAEAELSWPHADHANRETPVFDARDKLASIAVRSLVMAGAHDMEPPSKVQELHNGLPDSSFVVFEESGHFAPVEEPEKFRRAVFEFLGLTPTETSS